MVHGLCREHWEVLGWSRESVRKPGRGSRGSTEGKGASGVELRRGSGGWKQAGGTEHRGLRGLPQMASPSARTLSVL